MDRIIDLLIENIRLKQSIIIALSGGVDSSVVAALAFKALGRKAFAVTINSPLVPSSDLEDALKVSKYIGIKHITIPINELTLPGFETNPVNRCYLCKKYRFKKIIEFAEKMGIQTVADGTTADDVNEYRPGLNAIKELNVYSPLLEARLHKSEVRDIAKALNLPIYSKPSNSCLVTRIPYNEKLTIERLRRIDTAEKIVKNLVDVKLLRIRDHSPIARIEVMPEDLQKIVSENVREKIVEALKSLGFEFITVDLMGYTFGCYDKKYYKNEEK